MVRTIARQHRGISTADLRGEQRATDQARHRRRPIASLFGQHAQHPRSRRPPFARSARIGMERHFVEPEGYAAGFRCTASCARTFVARYDPTLAAGRRLHLPARLTAERIPPHRPVKRQRRRTPPGARNRQDRLGAEPLQPVRPLVQRRSCRMRARGHRLPALASPGGWRPRHRRTRNSRAIDHGATPVQVAIAWLLARSPVMAPIPGTSSLAHLEENAAAARLRLSADDLRDS